jgi:membrane-bound serine protease (ClpP class)
MVHSPYSARPQERLMSTLEWVTVALIVAGLLFIIAEVFLPTSGVLAVPGVLLLALAGALLLIEGSVDLGDIIVPVVIVTAILLILVGGGYAYRLRHMSPLTGADAMLGKQGTARSDLDPRGFVFVNGEYWSAESDAGSVQEGDTVIITAVNGLNLKVRKLSPKGARR